MAPSSEIKRKAELVMVEELTARCADLPFLPSRGSDGGDNAELPLVFAVVEALEAEKTLASEDTWMVQMAVGYITPIYDVPTALHSSNFRRIYDALKAIKGGWSAEHELRIHGLDITGTDDFQDAAKQAHGDVVSFVMGCSG